jgi:hypothetical protein
MKSILDPTFVYVPARETNLKRTFARVRCEVPVVDSTLRNRLENTLNAHKHHLSTYEELALLEAINFLERAGL